MARTVPGRADMLAYAGDSIYSNELWFYKRYDLYRVR
jgi:hypothetical protein